MKRDELIENIFNILNDEKLNHQNTTLSKTTLGAIEIDRLRLMYRFLSEHTIELNAQIKERPNCPITHIKQQNKATIGYKNSMIQYIAQFGLNLEGHPCGYTPGILERIANRCEGVLKNELIIPKK